MLYTAGVRCAPAVFFEKSNIFETCDEKNVLMG